MSIVAAYAVPHPPLIIPACGRGSEQGIAQSVASYKEVARRIAAHQPDVVIVSSPHAPAYRDAFALYSQGALSGSFEQFGAPEERIGVDIDEEVALCAYQLSCDCDDYAVVCLQPGEGVDHATFIPLWFINQRYCDYRVVVCGLSGLSNQAHFAWGRAIARAADQLGKRAVFIASGDLSHRLRDDGPYGFAPEGPLLDEAICNAFRQNDLDLLFDIDERTSQPAGECGLRSFMIMAGALDGAGHSGELLSYEGPFGVGYAVAAFEVE